MRQTARKLLTPLAKVWVKLVPPHVGYPLDFTPDEIALCAAVGPYTMTGPERIAALADATRYVVRNGIAGAIVECGVWRGGSMMAVARTLSSIGAIDRDLYLFDTFEGMTQPSALDRDQQGTTGVDALRSAPRTADFRPRIDNFSQWSLAPANATFNMWCIAPQEDVATNLRSTGYPIERVHMVRGRVEDTIPEHAPDIISLLRLDTDWYESTKHELEHLYDRLAPGGVLIVDDYGYWQGARLAVDEFFAGRKVAPLFHRIDFTARSCVKPVEAPAG